MRTSSRLAVESLIRRIQQADFQKQFAEFGLVIFADLLGQKFLRRRRVLLRLYLVPLRQSRDLAVGEMAIMDLERGLLDRAEEGITKAIASFFSLDCLGDARRLAKKLQRLADAFRVRGNENRAQELTQLLAISLSKAASTSK